MSLSKHFCLRSDSENRQSFSDSQSSHSLNERKEDNYRRDSFDDRFCDDLCEEILQYLSLEDKLRLQCVSKQFQRTVFQRQYELRIEVRGQKKYLINRIRSDDNLIEVQSLGSIKAVLKKCPNITSIFLDGMEYHYEVNEVFRIIIENCNNLNEINVLRDISDSNLQEFYRKFGPKIKCLQISKELDLNRFPNIEKVIINYVPDESIIAQLKLAKLKQLEIVFNKEHMLQTIIDTFPTLTHLQVVINSSGPEKTKRLKNISNLKHLIHLKLRIQFVENNDTICDLLKQMANICQNLKSIEFLFYINDKNSNIRQLLPQLKPFPALKRLSLDLILIDNEVEDNIDVNQLFSFELFKGFSNITHLTLCFAIPLSLILKESTLKEIDINLPKLKYLEINNKFDTTPEGVTQMADILSRLSRLETLKLKFKSGVVFEPIKDKIIEKCEEIKEIEFEIVWDTELDSSDDDSDSD